MAAVLNMTYVDEENIKKKCMASTPGMAGLKQKVISAASAA